MYWTPASEPPETQGGLLLSDLDGAIYLGYYDGYDFRELGPGNIRSAVAWWMSVPALPSNDPKAARSRAREEKEWHDFLAYKGD